MEFASRVSSDLDAYNTFYYFYSRGLISNHANLLAILELSPSPFKNSLIAHSVKVNIKDVTTTNAFTSFLLNDEHYTILYNKWTKLSKNKIILNEFNLV